MRDISMGAAEYRDAKDKLGFDHKQMAAVLGVTPRSSRRYASGEQTISVLVARELRSMLERFEEQRA